MNGIHEAEIPQMLRRVMKDMGYESSQEFIKDTTEDLWEDDEDEVPFDELPPDYDPADDCYSAGASDCAFCYYKENCSKRCDD